MLRITFTAGIVLIALGLGFYLAPVFMGEGPPHWTALIPAIPGVLLVALGALAAAKPDWRKHVMHVAMVLGVLVALAGLGRGVPGLLREVGTAEIASTLMGLIGLAFVIAGVKSFIDARRAQNEPKEPSEPKG